MAEVDTSFYKDATSENPLDMAGKVIEYKNKLLGNVHNQQTIEKTAIGIDSDKVDLAMKRFGIMNSAISGLIGDKGYGTENLKPKINGVMGRLVKDGVLSAQHAVEALQGIPDDPREQANVLRNFHSQTQSAIERGNSFFGSPQTQNVGNALVTTQTPQYPGKPAATRSEIPLALPPTTPTVQANPSQPNFGAQMPLGPTAIPKVQQGPGIMPATPEAPARAMVPSTPKMVGDREGMASGIYEGATPAQRVAGAHEVAKPIITALPPDVTAARGGAVQSYNDAMAAGAKYAQRVNPLRQAIPLLEKMKETDIGPTSERWNDLKSTAQTLGAGKVIGGIDPEKIRDYNELKKYFAQYASQAAATMGPKTNDGLATAITSNPNVHMDKLSATDLSKIAMGVERMQQAGAHEFDELVQTGKMQPGDFNKFMLKWGTNQDPRAFVYDIMDKKAQDKVKALPAAERAKVADGMRIAEKWQLLGDVHRE